MDFLGDALAKLSATPVQVAELVYGLSEEQLSWKPSPELFSMRENIWHLRDIDVEGYERRIRLILSEDAPKLSDVNGRKLAKERNYNVQPIDPALTELAIVRASSVERLSACKDADLERTAEMEVQARSRCGVCWRCGCGTMRSTWPTWQSCGAWRKPTMATFRLESKKRPRRFQISD